MTKFIMDPLSHREVVESNNGSLMTTFHSA